MKKYQAAAFLLIVLMVSDFFYRFQDIQFTESELKVKEFSSGLLDIRPGQKNSGFREDIYPQSLPSSSEQVSNNESTKQLSTDAIEFDQKTVKLLAISSRDGHFIATFKTTSVVDENSFGEYFHARAGDDLSGARLLIVEKNHIEVQVEEQRYVLKLFKSG